MKILITGGKGFVGSNLLEKLNNSRNQYKIFHPSRSELDLTNYKNVKIYLNQIRPDVIIHAAGESGWRTEKPTNESGIQNILMFRNLLNLKDINAKLINFGSGAEFSREKPINPATLKEPATDPYGFSKHIIQELGKNNPTVFNLRLFGCFGANESNERFIKSSLLKYIKKQNITIFQDRKMSFFYINDLYKIIDKIITNQLAVRNIDCVYEDTLLLTEVAGIINGLADYKVDIIKLSDNQGLDYVGDPNIFPGYFPKTLERMFDLKGLNLGIEEVYLQLKDG